MAFVHLHNHSDYSMLDGASRVEDMVQRAADLRMPAVALTDHGYMYGIPDLALAADAVNANDPAFVQWEQDKKAAEAGQKLTEPATDAPREAFTQYQNDLEAVEAGNLLETTKPAPRVKPIFGCEIYFTPDSTLARDKKPQLYHMILLAKNETGYVNLMKLVSEAATEGFYYKPRVTLENLQKHAEGLIGTSGCVAGIVPVSIMENNPEEALRWAKTFKDIFAPGDFYLEIQDHGLEVTPGWPDRKLAETITELAHSIGVKTVATNDFHYLLRDDANTQDVVECIGTGSQLDQTDRLRMDRAADGTGEFYMKTEEEMRALFDWNQEACDTTLEIAEKCNYQLDWSKLYLPKFPLLEEGETSEERFRKECEAGLAIRYGDDWQTREINGVNIKERFETEYDVICTKGFADYFLIVQEYVQWAKDHGIGVGPGRGSAAGAIVAYALNITTIDPLENGLMFERFLSIERTEMPDIDMDFDDERREEVIQHVRELYGSARVSHVITYSTIKAKQAIQDSARVLGLPYSTGLDLSKMVPSDPGVKLYNVLHKVPGHEDSFNADLVKAAQENEEYERVLETALSIEGLKRADSMHACAILITPTPVNDHVPTKLDKTRGVEITQYEGHSVADMGLLKMDFLGLRTLTVISKALKNIKANYNTAEAVAKASAKVKEALREPADKATSLDIDVDKIPFDDPAIFELMGKGKTSGVFQIESQGMTATIRQMQPKEYRQVVALIALYRPGPLGSGMVQSYVCRMNGKEQVRYYDPRLESILSETYGTIVYQEQVMQISMVMSGFSAGESDSRIRKPMAKKKLAMLTKQEFDWENGAHETTYDHWMKGAVANNFKRETAERIWNEVLEFASYAFNKSHSAGYAILVMQTAWLKAYFPHEYMAAVLTSYTGKTDKIQKYINACRHEGINVLPPDINESGIEFTAVEEGIRFGLAGIKGVGVAAAQAIIGEREKNGPFETLHDLVSRVEKEALKRGALEALIKAGAFDFSGYPRMQLMGFIDKNNPKNIVDVYAARAKNEASGQSSLLDLVSAENEIEGLSDEIPDPDVDAEWERTIKLQFERDVLGIFVSDHPLSPYTYQLAQTRTYSLAQIQEGVEEKDEAGNVVLREVPENVEFTLSGMVSGFLRLTTKKGDSMARFNLEDLEAEIEVIVFPKVFSKTAQYLESNGRGEAYVSVTGTLERSDRGNQFKARTIEPLELDEAKNLPKTLEVTLPSEKLSHSMVERLASALTSHPGLDTAELFVQNTSGEKMRLEMPAKIDATNVILFAKLQQLVEPEGRVTLVG